MIEYRLSFFLPIGQVFKKNVALHNSFMRTILGGTGVSGLTRMQDVTVSGSSQQSCTRCGYRVWVSPPSIVSHRGTGPAILQPGLVFGYTPVS